jgi:hypothetical protein
MLPPRFFQRIGISRQRAASKHTPEATGSKWRDTDARTHATEDLLRLEDAAKLGFMPVRRHDGKRPWHRGEERAARDLPHRQGFTTLAEVERMKEQSRIRLYLQRQGETTPVPPQRQRAATVSPIRHAPYAQRKRRQGEAPLSRSRRHRESRCANGSIDSTIPVGLMWASQLLSAAFTRERSERALGRQDDPGHHARADTKTARWRPDPVSSVPGSRPEAVYQRASCGLRLSRRTRRWRDRQFAACQARFDPPPSCSRTPGNRCNARLRKLRPASARRSSTL